MYCYKGSPGMVILCCSQTGEFSPNSRRIASISGSAIRPLAVAVAGLRKESVRGSCDGDMASPIPSTW